MGGYQPSKFVKVFSIKIFPAIYTGMVTVGVNLVTKDDHKTLGVVSAGGGGGGGGGGGRVPTSAGTTASASAPPSNEEALLSK